MGLGKNAGGQTCKWKRLVAIIKVECSWGYYIFFIRFLITPDFITEPYFQYYGPGYDGPPGSGNSGQMKFSQSGNTLVLTRHSYIEIYDFDRCSGIASNVQSILVQEGDFIYGCEFSDEGRMLYLTSVGYELSSAKLYQYCLTCPG